MRFSSIPTSIRRPLAILTILGLSITASLAFWGATGHRIINLKASMHLPASMSTYKADSSFYAAHASDADGRKNNADTSFYAEAQRHFLNIEDYPNYHSLTHNLDSAQMLYGRTNVHTRGTLPWATVMVMDSLTAQIRRNDVTSLKQTMSDLGHYVGDAHQPLHCTANYDGFATGNNGIHSRYETSMINTYQSQLVIVPDAAQYISNPIDYIFNYIYQSNSYVDSIMAADNYAKSVSGWSGSGSAPASYYTALWSATQNLTKERFQHATVALASLWYTAWMNAQTYQLPQYMMAASANAHGTLVPAGSFLTDSGTTQRFVFAPETGYHLDSVLVDGVPVDSTEGYTFNTISAGHTFRVVFAIDRFIVTSVAGLNGTISPSGDLSIAYGGRQIYTVTPDPGYEIDSILIDGIYSGHSSPDTVRLVYAPHSIRAVFKIAQMQLSLAVSDKWNIVSVPLVMNSYAKSTLFSGASSDAFSFSGSYVSSTVLSRGVGYWIKFSGAATVPLTGYHVSADTVQLSEGWNLIGTPSDPVSVSGITIVTDGLTLSQFFGFSGGYVAANTLQPGFGYWVKANMSGSIILTGGARTSSQSGK